MSGTVRNPAYGAAMTFEEIGRELGISHQAVQQYYARGLSKLRRQTPNAVELLRLYAQQLGHERREREAA